MSKVWFVLVICLLFVLNFGCISLGNGADGTAYDSVARVSYGGWVWKTWRVELTNDHPVSNGDGGVVAQRYGVVNDSGLIDELEYCAEMGTKTKIYYKGNLAVWDWEYSDAEVIYKIESCKEKDRGV
jgi:hypothetical protein